MKKYTFIINALASAVASIWCTYFLIYHLFVTKEIIICIIMFLCITINIHYFILVIKEVRKKKKCCFFLGTPWNKNDAWSVIEDKEEEK